MVETRKKSAVITAIAIGALGIVTGLFLGGSLLPSQGKGQLYDVRQTITITTTSIVDGSGEHTNIMQVKTTEKVPRGTQFTLAVAAAGGGGGQAGGDDRGPYDVWLLQQDFFPSLLTVPAGTTITWINKSPESHTVSSVTGLFDAGVDPGQSYSYTFTTPGLYEYTCSPHPEMTGAITVK